MVVLASLLHQIPPFSLLLRNFIERSCSITLPLWLMNMRTCLAVLYNSFVPLPAASFHRQGSLLTQQQAKLPRFFTRLRTVKLARISKKKKEKKKKKKTITRLDHHRESNRHKAVVRSLCSTPIHHQTKLTKCDCC